jgi:hypothetical protein
MSWFAQLGGRYERFSLLLLSAILKRLWTVPLAILGTGLLGYWLSGISRESGSSQVCCRGN